MESPTFDGEVLKMWIENDILCGVYKVETVDLPSARKATDERLKFTEEKDIVVLVDYTKVRNTTKEAREYFSIDESSRHITAMALLIGSPVGSMMANFYLRINRPAFPFKFFTDKEKAKSWLQQYTKQ